MLRYKKKVDFEAIYNKTERLLTRWREIEEQVPAEIRAAFREKLLISIIYHDAALEGEVLTHSEIKASIDKSIISDTSLIPSYEEINNFNNACERASEVAANRRKAIKFEVIKELQSILEPDATANTYRKENPLHRLYYHEISPPDKVSYRMRKLSEWLEKGGGKDMRTIERAALLHWQLMAIFPWIKGTGRTARIAANLILAHAGYPQAVIHSIDRQRYYESLRSGDHKALFHIYLEAVQTTATAAIRVYEEAWAKGRRKRAS